jgi:hypothetical protein
MANDSVRALKRTAKTVIVKLVYAGDFTDDLRIRYLAGSAK